MSERRLSGSRRFPRGCVASPHHLASSVGLAVLAGGGNAVDAAVATNLTLGVVAPYLCGYGGDLFALVWREGEGLAAYNGSGRAPAAATVEAVRTAAASDQMPAGGPLPVTVPGVVRGWFDLLERFGTRSFGELASTALGYAQDGFTPSDHGAAAVERSQRRFAHLRDGSASTWWSVYGGVAAGRALRQPGLARTIALLAQDGPDAYHGGPIGEAIAGCVQVLGGLMALEDLRVHSGDWVEPLRSSYRGIEIVEMPPNTQGIAVLEALGIVEALGPLPTEGAERQHLLIEAIKLAFVDRDAFVTDGERMQVDPGWLCSPAWVRERVGEFDPERAGTPAAGRAAQGGTAYLCAADADGTLVSLIQSNYMGFGSGVTVPDWGINLHNRGAFFSLDPAHANVIAPRKRTLHTLIPAMAFREGKPWIVFGTMGGDGQAQTQLQMVVRMVDDSADPQKAIDAPRWVVSLRDWTVTAEDGFAPEVLDALRARGHVVGTSAWFDPLFGHAHAIEVTEHDYVGATDPRTEGAVLGL